MDVFNVAEEDSEDLSYSDLDTFPEFLLERNDSILSLQLDHNNISIIPRCVVSFQNLVSLDMSNNRISYISPEIGNLLKLRTLIMRNNRLDDSSIPKELAQLKSLQVLNISGNHLQEFPPSFLELTNLKRLYFGANNLTAIPRDIQQLQCLEVLYLGGNKLEDLPCELGMLESLVSLVLCDNNLEGLPSSLSFLHNLQSLSLHNNRLCTLPSEIVKLNLVELSLRNNPLVMKFVQDMTFEPPSLLELAGRTVKIKSVAYCEGELPANLIEYLDSASCCVNPKCKGVYFTSRVEHVKFVDFCGKYRLPLLEYLCSPLCKSRPLVVSSSSESDSEDETFAPVVSKMKKVLLPQDDAC